jgi:hypothetical protein
MHGRKEKCIQSVGRKACIKEATSKLRVGWRVMLALRNQNGRTRHEATHLELGAVRFVCPVCACLVLAFKIPRIEFS